MKISYWYARVETDSECCSIRARTKREALNQLKFSGRHRFGPLVKVTVEGEPFDILSEALGEGGLCAESTAHWAAVDKEKVK